MGKINWARVFLGGLVFGVVVGVLLFFDVILLGSDFMRAVEATGQFPATRVGQLGMCVAAMIFFGIWTLWLYAAIRPRYGPGPKTAVIAGLATSLYGISADIVWGSMGFVRLAALVPIVGVAVPIIIGATLLGAWAYKE